MGGIRSDRHHLPSLRLQRGLRQLGRWLERPEEAVVLRERREGLPTAGRRLCLRNVVRLWTFRVEGMAEVLALCAIFWRLSAMPCGASASHALCGQCTVQ